MGGQDASEVPAPRIARAAQGLVHQGRARARADEQLQTAGAQLAARGQLEPQGAVGGEHAALVGDELGAPGAHGHLQADRVANGARAKGGGALEFEVPRVRQGRLAERSEDVLEDAVAGDRDGRDGHLAVVPAAGPEPQLDLAGAAGAVVDAGHERRPVALGQGAGRVELDGELGAGHGRRRGLAQHGVGRDATASHAPAGRLLGEVKAHGRAAGLVGHHRRFPEGRLREARAHAGILPLLLLVPAEGPAAQGREVGLVLEEASGAGGRSVPRGALRAAGAAGLAVGHVPELA